MQAGQFFTSGRVKTSNNKFYNLPRSNILMPDLLRNRFSFFVPFTKQKVYPDIHKNAAGGYTLVQDGQIVSDFYLEGIASTTSVDRDTEKMSEKALWKMKTEILDHPVNIFGNHDHNWENSLGVVKEADVRDGKFWVKILLDDPTTNPKIASLVAKLKKGIGLGLSVGGKVLDTFTEFDKALNKKVTVIDDLELYEISVVGVPANKECMMGIAGQIAKSAKLHKQEQNESKSICHLCFGEIEDGTCTRCFTKAEKTLICSNCGKEVKTCSYCEKPIKEGIIICEMYKNHYHDHSSEKRFVFFLDAHTIARAEEV